MEEPLTGRADETHAGTSRRNGDPRRENHCNARMERDGDHAWDIEHWLPWKTEVEEVRAAAVAAAVVVAVVVAAAAAAHWYDSRWAVFARP